MFEIILAAVDGSSRTAGVVAAAEALAERFGGRVHLFRAVALSQEFPPSAHAHKDPAADELAARARTELEALAAGRARFVVEAPVVGPSEPWRSVLEAAVAVDAGLIVVGSHGFRGWDRVLGTTAAKIVNHADRPVLVVRAPGGARP